MLGPCWLFGPRLRRGSHACCGWIIMGRIMTAEKATPRSVAASQAAFDEAKRVLAGGVNSPVRAFGAVGGTPLFIARAEGATLTDVDGNSYIDYVGSWGPM